MSVRALLVLAFIVCSVFGRYVDDDDEGQAMPVPAALSSPTDAINNGGFENVWMDPHAGTSNGNEESQASSSSEDGGTQATEQKRGHPVKLRFGKRGHPVKLRFGKRGGQVVKLRFGKRQFE